jgi:plastocyanin
MATRRRPTPELAAPAAHCSSRAWQWEAIVAEQTFKPGDKVSWNTPQGETHGVVEHKVTGEERVQGHVARASKEHPEYRVKSDRSGKEAIHRPEQLRKD